jgi:hypothetical protein
MRLYGLTLSSFCSHCALCFVCTVLRCLHSVHVVLSVLSVRSYFVSILFTLCSLFRLYGLTLSPFCSRCALCFVCTPLSVLTFHLPNQLDGSGLNIAAGVWGGGGSCSKHSLANFIFVFIGPLCTATPTLHGALLNRSL